MARYAIIDSSDIIQNFAEWDGATQWLPPAGTKAMPAPMTCGIGWRWNKGLPIDLNPPPIIVPPVPPVRTPAQKLAATGLTVAELKTLLGLPLP